VVVLEEGGIAKDSREELTRRGGCEDVLRGGTLVVVFFFVVLGWGVGAVVSFVVGVICGGEGGGFLDVVRFVWGWVVSWGEVALTTLRPSPGGTLSLTSHGRSRSL